jgi:hypothetical protein
VASGNYKRIFGQKRPVMAMVHLGGAWKPIDPQRATEFLHLARAARKG